MPEGVVKPRLPAGIEAALVEILGAGVSAVRLVPDSLYARLHGRAAATTRRNTIYLRGGVANFASDPLLLLHEYFHVLNQWHSRRLTLWKYLLESARRGYSKNRFEIEARDFAALNLHRLETAIAKRGGFELRDAGPGGTGAGRRSPQHRLAAPVPGGEGKKDRRDADRRPRGDKHV